VPEPVDQDGEVVGEAGQVGGGVLRRLRRDYAPAERLVRRRPGGQPECRSEARGQRVPVYVDDAVWSMVTTT
jgi:hypothetical protein